MYEFVTRDTAMSVVRIDQCSFYSFSLGQLKLPYAGVRRAGIPLYKGIVSENWRVLVSMVGDQLVSPQAFLGELVFHPSPPPRKTPVWEARDQSEII